VKKTNRNEDLPCGAADVGEVPAALIVTHNYDGDSAVTLTVGWLSAAATAMNWRPLVTYVSRPSRS
jgi:hypothetical protein